MVAFTLLTNIVFVWAVSRNAEAEDEGRTPEQGEMLGALDDYFAKITALSDAEAHDRFFASAVVEKAQLFVQVSADANDGDWTYTFSLPVIGWSKKYIDMIDVEAGKRGFDSDLPRTGRVRVFKVQGLSQEDHLEFATWVVRDVFRVSASTDFKIIWG